MVNKNFIFDTDGFKHYHDTHVKSSIDSEKLRAEGVESSQAARITTLETAVGSGGSVDERIAAEATARDTAIAAETTRATTAEENLRQLYNNLQQSQPIPVTSLPASGESGKIYRLAGSTSYADYMWDGTQFIKMAEYDNAIDDEPTAGSDNLVKSGGVAEQISQLGQYTNSSKFIQVITDGEDKILEGIKEEGRKIINIPISTPAIDVDHSQSKEYVSVVLDKDERVVSARDANGKLNENVGVATPLVETDTLYINEKIKLTERALLLLRNSIGDVDISTDRKKQAFSALYKDAGDMIESFLFYTDPHYFESNDSCKLSEDAKEYIRRIKNYFDNTPTDFVINGGDWLNTHQQLIGIEDLGWVDGIMRNLFGDNYFPVFGNHESNPYSGGNNIPIEIVRNLWFRRWGKMYYSFQANNSRFYVLDSGSDGTLEMDSYRWEQVDWFANELIEGEDANIVMVIHIGDLNYTNPSLFGQETPPITDNLTKIAEAYNNREEITLNGKTYDFSSETGIIHCLLCGHSHYDANAIINSIPTVCFDDAMTGNFSLVLLDFDNRKLKSIRVGTGDNREITIL